MGTFLLHGDRSDCFKNFVLFLFLGLHERGYIGRSKVDGGLHNREKANCGIFLLVD